MFYLRIDTPEELTYVHDLQIGYHWLNSRLNKTYGSNFLEAFQAHGFKWNDGTDIELKGLRIDCCDRGPKCNDLPFCLLQRFDSTILTFISCNAASSVNNALCQLKVTEPTDCKAYTGSTVTIRPSGFTKPTGPARRPGSNGSTESNVFYNKNAIFHFFLIAIFQCYQFAA